MGKDDQDLYKKKIRETFWIIVYKSVRANCVGAREKKCEESDKKDTRTTQLSQAMVVEATEIEIRSTLTKCTKNSVPAT